MHSRQAWIAFALSLALLGACSSGSSTGSGATQPSTTTAAASSPTSGALPTSGASAEPITKNHAAAALLTLNQLPGTFQDVGWQPQVGPEALPSCAKAPTDRRIDVNVPPLILVGRNARDTRSIAQYNEELRVYPDIASATAAYTAIRAGEVCTNGTIFRDTGTTTPIHIASPRDVTTSVAADTATEFLEQTAGFDDKLVVARVGRLVVRFDFITNLGANVAFLGDPLTTAKSGIAKVHAL